MRILTHTFSLLLLFCLTWKTSAQQLAFNDFAHIGGSDLQAGSTYRFYNVVTGVDATINVTSLTNATLLQIDDSPIDSNSADDAAFRPVFSAISASQENELHYVDFTIQFFANGGNTPVALDQFTMSLYDIDGDGDSFFADDGNILEFAQVAGFESMVSSGEKLNITDYGDGSVLIMTKDSTENPGINNAAPWLSVWDFKNNNAFSLRFGWMGNDYVDSEDNIRDVGAYFTGSNTPTVVPIPEPSSSVLVLLGAITLISRRRR
ncbi:hypothetical protein NT6N_10130 [Oceaniferula spumae]|uniref:PEP-CTERM protein-sorting domain-containing protein n=1 Tax=Oceaniferula spumae TaxID=2979115 RepID=A0AAT9FJ29_9BACT